MGLFNTFNVSGSALSAQTIRMNTTASNLANVNSAASSIEETYRARHPVFKTMIDQYNRPEIAAVGVAAIVESDAELKAEYRPNHPMANDEGYIYMPNVNPIEEMANMIDASRSYQTNVEIINSSKQMLMRTINMGQ